jgi:chromosome segregation ATPase
MAEEPDNLVLRLLREMRADANVEFAHLNETLQDVRRHVVSLDMRVEALDEKFETIREGTISAIGFAANASRAHVDLHKQIADLTKRVEKLEAAR